MQTRKEWLSKWPTGACQFSKFCNKRFYSNKARQKLFKKKKCTYATCSSLIQSPFLRYSKGCRSSVKLRTHLLHDRESSNLIPLFASRELQIMSIEIPRFEIHMEVFDSSPEHSTQDVFKVPRTFHSSRALLKLLISEWLALLRKPGITA